MRTKGKISSWNDGRGFGFITPNAGGRRVFVHIRAFANTDRRPAVGQLVNYAMSTDKQGRPCAAKATLAGDRLPQKTKSNAGRRSVIYAILFLAVVGVFVLASKLPFLILVAYLAASLITFVTYYLDKSAAKSGGWRISENTLHLLSLAGGWPGALVAQQKLRHKSKKESFRVVFWVIVLLNCGALAWLFSSDG